MFEHVYGNMYMVVSLEAVGGLKYWRLASNEI